MMAALYLMSPALLPAGFGRAGPAHVFWNGLSVLLLSAVGISLRPRWQQVAWGCCLTAVILWMCNISRSVNWFEMGPVVHAEAAVFRDVLEGKRPVRVSRNEGGFDLRQPRAIVGHDPIATPVEVPLQVERALRAAVQYTPSFYGFYFNLFDAAAEDRQIQELNESK